MEKIRDTSEMRLWLFDLAHGNLTDDAIVKGFVKYYALNGLVPANVQQDIHFHTLYGNNNCQHAMEDLTRALTEYANAPEPPESRTLAEIREIVDCVRSGIPVQIDYYNAEEEDTFVYKKCW